MSTPINFNDPELKILRSLVDITDDELLRIATNIGNNRHNIQMLDYMCKLGLQELFVSDVKQRQAVEIPDGRKKYWDRYNKTILSLRTTEHNLSLLRLNPFTKFEENPPLFFGMGGGSKALCKGLPFDVLSMVLTAEKLRRELGLSECRVLLANRITYTNIPKSSEFSKESIDTVMRAERDILRLVVDKFGFGDKWNIFLQTDLESVVGSDVKAGYEALILKGDNTSLVGGHHYAIEMADIWSLVGQEQGGIKLGWFIRGIDKKNGGYIMDEQPFHARFNLFMALEDMRNNVTLAYANAGARLYPGKTGDLEKESPYICYQPENRVLLSPFENPVEKLMRATNEGGGFQYKYVRNLMSGIVQLFDDLVLGEQQTTSQTREASEEFRGKDLALRVEQIERFIFDGEKEMETIWKSAFPESVIT